MAERPLTDISVASKEGSWYLLPQTGFNVALQVDRFEKDIKTGNSLDQAFQKIEQDIQGFKTEYLCEGLLFPIVLDKQIVNGRQRIVAPLYGNQLLVETVSEKERRGAIKKSVEDVEEFLISAPPGSMAVLTSPDGWSGFSGITYQDTQTYLWRVMEDGKPMGFTVRTDMTLAQNQKLLEYLGKDLTKRGSMEDQLVEIVSNPMFIRSYPDQKQWHFEDLVDIIKYAKGSDVAYKNRLFEEIYQQLHYPQKLWTLDSATQKLTSDLKTFIQNKLANETFKRQDLEIALGSTVLKLAQAIMQPQLYKPTQTFYQQDIHPQQAIAGYRAMLSIVQKLPGCNGGGGSNQKAEVFVFAGSLTPRLAINELFTDGEDTSDFPCGGTKKDGSPCTYIVKYGSGIKKCPECGNEAKCA
ncbi:MAG: hypothetical protein Q8P25_00050 [Candidatus Curtissbacteria bacterium]|nr:hypothetical protein [Candidatus Curtissbacteria bacterium]